MVMFNYELLIWDMDGTLLQTADIVPDSFIETARACGQDGYSREAVVKLYSLGVPENMLSEMLKRVPEKEEMELFYQVLKEKAVNVAVYSDIEYCLKRIALDMKLAVFTGASQRSAEILLNAAELTKYFDLVLGGDKHPPKPDPSGILDVVSRLESSVCRTAYVGDAPTDMKAATAAQVHAFAAGWGHLHVAESGENRLFVNPSELADYLTT